MKKLIVTLGIIGSMLPFGAMAATAQECADQGRTLGSDNECHPTMADCQAMQGGPILEGYKCVIVGGGGVPGGYRANAEWKSAPVHHDNAFGVDMVDLSGTSWWANYKAQWKAAWPNGYFQ